MIINWTSTSAKSRPRPGKRKRANAYAARVTSTSCAISTIVTSMTVFRKYRANGAACQALMKLASVHGADSTNRVEYSGAWNAVQSAYTSGNTHRIPRSHAAAVSSTLIEPCVDCDEVISPRRTGGTSIGIVLIGNASVARETEIARA